VVGGFGNVNSTTIDLYRQLLWFTVVAISHGLAPSHHCDHPGYNRTSAQHLLHGGQHANFPDQAQQAGQELRFQSIDTEHKVVPDW
jgi:hypothetical protein